MSDAAPLLLLGSQGQVARAVQRLAPALLPGRPLVVASRPELDLASPTTDLETSLATLLDRRLPAVVLNAAAYTAVDRAEEQSALAQAVNGDAVGVLARLCAARDLPLFHLSTDYVFNGSGERPWREGDPVGPLGAYGASKLAGEQALNAAGGRHLLLRVSWVFGQEGANFVRTMLRLAADRPALRVVNDQVGGPTSAEAIARTWLALAPRALADPTGFAWGTFHYAGAPAVSWYAFAAEIFRQAVELGLLPAAPSLEPIPTAAYPTPARRPANSRLDGSAFSAAFGLPQPDWRDDLRQCLLAWRSQP